MKQVKIEVQITKNLGNYESVRLGGEWSLDEGEDQQAAYKAAIAELNAIYAAQYLREKPAKVAQTDTRKHISFNDDVKTLQAICTRINKDASVTRETIDTYYTFDEQASKVVNLAIKMRDNGKKV